MAGSAIATTGLVGTAAAKPSQPEIYEQSLRLRRKNGWDISKWANFLNQRGVQTTGFSETVMVPYPTSDGDDDVSTQKYDRYESTVSFSRSEVHSNGDLEYVAINFDVDNKAGDLDDYGEGPPDNIGIAFDDSHYDRYYGDDEWIQYGNYLNDPPDVNSKDPNHGAVADWHDGNDGDNSAWFQIWVVPKSGTTTSSRELEFDYAHTWYQGDLEGVSFGSGGGLGFTFSTETKRWDIERSHTAEQLTDGESFSPSK
ncbi:hypothetical protein [Halorussus aquaticus]|uniref:Uncharacterized protein n=1 Tax=Halorussus aquaticus TaxID=2953748 RepID=A0ABD5Q069_9EURY|nr:hypothetical protein [Halorussus aquaticus]